MEESGIDHDEVESC